MLKHRLIPVLLLMNGHLVRSELFTIHQIIGLPRREVWRFNEWNVDELIYLDISREEFYDVRRSDHGTEDMNSIVEIIEKISETCFMPLTFGGRIRSVEDMRLRFSHGADKITINSEAVRNRQLITDGANVFGSQAIVLSMDVLRSPDGKTEVYIDCGRESTGMDPATWAKEAEDRGAGEILLQVIDRDGVANGYDLELIEAISSVTSIPLIVCSGVGQPEHYPQGIKAGGSAAAAANIWHFTDLTDRSGKRALTKAGLPVRPFDTDLPALLGQK